jgi:hypothetical protein
MPTSPEYKRPVNEIIELGVPQPEQDNTLRKRYSTRQLLVICFSVGVFMASTLPDLAVSVPWGTG